MQQQETSAWGGLTPAQAAEKFPMPSIAECIEQDRQVAAEEDRLQPACDSEYCLVHGTKRD